MTPIRWRVAELLERLPGQCWLDLSAWASRRAVGRSPWRPRSLGCSMAAVQRGRCYCGKLRRDGSIRPGVGTPREVRSRG